MCGWFVLYGKRGWEFGVDGMFLCRENVLVLIVCEGLMVVKVVWVVGWYFCIIEIESICMIMMNGVFGCNGSSNGWCFCPSGVFVLVTAAASACSNACICSRMLMLMLMILKEGTM